MQKTSNKSIFQHLKCLKCVNLQQYYYNDFVNRHFAERNNFFPEQQYKAIDFQTSARPKVEATIHTPILDILWLQRVKRADPGKPQWVVSSLPVRFVQTWRHPQNRKYITLHCHQRRSESWSQLSTGVGTGPTDSAAAGPIIWQTRVFRVHIISTFVNTNWTKTPVEKCIHRGQLILRKISKFDATRCH